MVTDESNSGCAHSKSCFCIYLVKHSEEEEKELHYLDCVLCLDIRFRIQRIFRMDQLDRILELVKLPARKWFADRHSEHVRRVSKQCPGSFALLGIGGGGFRRVHPY